MLRKVHPDTGEVLLQYKFGDDVFAEGIAVSTIDSTHYIYVLTWKNSKLFVFDPENLSLISTHFYNTFTGEGWGVTHDPTSNILIVSDGSNKLGHFQPPLVSVESSELNKMKQISVFYNESPLNDINELEYAGGFVYANVWYQNVIVKINATDGAVANVYDMSDLYYPRDRNADCLNGIAYSESEDVFVVTGKLWPKYYVIKL